MTRDVTNGHGVDWRHMETQAFQDIRTLWYGQMDGLTRTDMDAPPEASRSWR